MFVTNCDVFGQKYLNMLQPQMHPGQEVNLCLLVQMAANQPLSATLAPHPDKTWFCCASGWWCRPT